MNFKEEILASVLKNVFKFSVLLLSVKHCLPLLLIFFSSPELFMHLCINVYVCVDTYMCRHVLCAHAYGGLMLMLRIFVHCSSPYSSESGSLNQIPNLTKVTRLYLRDVCSLSSRLKFHPNP